MMLILAKLSANCYSPSKSPGIGDSYRHRCNLPQLFLAKDILMIHHKNRLTSGPLLTISQIFNDVSWYFHGSKVDLINQILSVWCTEDHILLKRNPVLDKCNHSAFS